MSRYLSPRFASLAEYVPGEQPLGREYVKLNTNESPYPPSPGVLRAISRAEVSRLNLYSDPDCRELIPALAASYGLKSENVFVSNGSDETLCLCFMAFCGPERGVAFPDVSYGFYEVYANLYGLDARKIPLRADWTLDPADYRALGRTIVIANPNAPTGLTVPLAGIEEIVRSNPDCVVVVDEAYVDFGGETALPLVRDYDNVLICRTFSKSRSLAGARLGFALGPAGLIADLAKLKNSTNPYNINRLTNAAGIAALDDWAYYAANIRRIVDAREYAKAELRRRGFLVTDSAANFLFAASPALGGGALYAGLRERGVLVRHFAAPRVEDWLRITVGTREQMDVLLSALDDLMGGCEA